MALVALIAPRTTPASVVSIAKPLHLKITLIIASHVKKNHKTPLKKKKSALFVVIHLILMSPLLRAPTDTRYASITLSRVL